MVSSQLLEMGIILLNFMEQIKSKVFISISVDYKIMGHGYLLKMRMHRLLHRIILKLEVMVLR